MSESSGQSGVEIMARMRRLREEERERQRAEMERILIAEEQQEIARRQARLAQSQSDMARYQRELQNYGNNLRGSWEQAQRDAERIQSDIEQQRYEQFRRRQLEYYGSWGVNSSGSSRELGSTRSYSVSFQVDPFINRSQRSRVETSQHHIVVPIVETLPESGKVNDMVMCNKRIWVYDGHSWNCVTKEDAEPEEIKGRKIVVGE